MIPFSYKICTPASDRRRAKLAGARKQAQNAAPPSGTSRTCPRESQQVTSPSRERQQGTNPSRERPQVTSFSRERQQVTSPSTARGEIEATGYESSKAAQNGHLNKGGRPDSDIDLILAFRTVLQGCLAHKKLPHPRSLQ